MNRPLFPTTLSTPSYDIGKQVELRTYQRPLVIQVGWTGGEHNSRQKERSLQQRHLYRTWPLFRRPQ